MQQMVPPDDDMVPHTENVPARRENRANERQSCYWDELQDPPPPNDGPVAADMEFPCPPALKDNSVFLYNEAWPAAKKFALLGKQLAQVGDLYRRPEYANGLLLAASSPNVPPKLIVKGAQLACIIADRLNLIVVNNGKLKTSGISGGELSTMLGSEAFLQQFRALDFRSEEHTSEL